MAIPFDFERLETVLDTFPRKQRDLAQAMLERPEVFAFGTLRALENSFSISGVTVIRFAKRLGYDGYADLQTAVRQAYFERVGFQMPREPGASLESEGNLVGATVAQQRANLESAVAGLDEEALAAVADSLVSARRILAYGSGSARVVAQLLVRLLRHVGLRGEMVESAGVDGVIALHDVTEEDVVVGVNLWLSFSDLVSHLKLAKRLGAKTVVISGSHVSQVHGVADHVLAAPAQGVAQSFSVVAPVAIVEILIAKIASYRREETARIRQALHDLYVEEAVLASTGRPKVNGK